MEEKKQVSVKCAKCAKDFVTDGTQNKEKLLCETCTKKKKRRTVLICGIAVALLVTVATIIFVVEKNGRQIESFDGIENITDSIALEQQEIAEINLANLTASCAPISSEGGTIDNIESFKRYMDDAIAEAEKNNSTQLSIPPIGILFELNSSVISRESEAFVKEFARYYSLTNKQATILVEGYTCDLGSEWINENLSKQRADAVSAILLKNSIPSDKIDVKWYGKSKYGTFTYQSKKEYRRVNVSIK